MEFDEIVVKESPGLCRCCLSEGCYKDLGTEYAWMDETEVYADMLLECFDISISQHMEGPNGPNRLICEVCITRLRDACNFKKQVLDSEKKFVDMVGRGEFKSKVIVYQEQMKSEMIMEPQPAHDADVEYLDEEIDYDDGNKDDSNEPTVSEDITVDALPIKGKRGRPKKTTVKPEKKKSKLEEKAKPKIVKGMRIEKDYQETYSERLNILRKNIMLILQYGNVVPFHWNTRGFRCFYCGRQMKDCETLKEHTLLSHKSVDLHVFIPQRIISKDVPVKIDITDMTCKSCDISLTTVEDLISHIVAIHEEEYDNSVGVCVFPFVLNKDVLQCVLCDDKYDNFTSMLGHMYKKHIAHTYICQICGLSFIDQVRLKRHISNSHEGHRCKICGKVFDASHKVDKHKQRIHGVQRTVECNLCSENFENQYQLKVHMGKVHNVEKYRIKCEHCPKICTTKGAMLLHVQSRHSDARFECDLCDYKTGIKWMIKLHRRKHFGEKNYICSICDRRFGRSSNLRAHMKVHTGSFGRVCRWCRQGFTDSETLDRHEKDLHYFSQYN
ncbi:zinc finger protein 596-like isoform X9 [Vanessa atalanta]|uniref:zinc finger protein 596-like isoform X9 n=1 Tax=Vanessa atalanta TaxID=42275 RepID=UPI001FCD31B7|nr:zinc finger protein 596-like isoform X9 [Vanessa atalanta]